MVSVVGSSCLLDGCLDVEGQRERETEGEGQR